MQETGQVKSIEGPICTVVVEKKNMCEHCTAGTCSFEGDGAVLEALNDIGAKVGQTVKVELRPSTYVKSTMMIYGLPALALIAGAIAGPELGVPGFPNIVPDLVSAIYAFSAFGLSLVGVKLWARGAEKKTEYRPVVTKVLDDGQDNNDT